jgi:hypothetical protein
MAYGALAAALHRKAEKDASARELAEAASESYELDETEKTEITLASENAKRTMENQILTMQPEEFIKSPKGGKAIRKTLNELFNRELGRLFRSTGSE